MRGLSDKRLCGEKKNLIEIKATEARQMRLHVFPVVIVLRNALE